VTDPTRDRSARTHCASAVISTSSWGAA
jgi:hypothetical protein